MSKNALKMAVLLAGLGVGAVASADPVTGTLLARYYTDTGNDPDFQGHCCSDFFNNMVNLTLYNGLPTLNTAYSSNPANPVINDVDANGNINWWGRGSDVSNNSHLSYDGAGYTTMLPISLTGIYSPHDSGSSDQSAFQTAIFSGVFKTTGPSTTLDFSLRGDDDAFVFVDGTVVQQVGGVHPIPSSPDLASVAVGGGWHTLEVFYADRHTVDANLDFSIDAIGSKLTIMPSVPEPETWALLGLGLLGIGWLARRYGQSSGKTTGGSLLLAA